MKVTGGGPAEAAQEWNSSALPTDRGDIAHGRVESLVAVSAIPEEELWLEGQLSPETRRAYRADVRQFCVDLGIAAREDLRSVSRGAIVAWLRSLERRRASPRTVRRKLSALSSLFTHLVEYGLAGENPVRGVKRPRVNRRHGTTASFDQRQARAILDAPAEATLQGIRDRAILSVGFQVGPRRAEIASLKVRDFCMNQRFWSLRFVRRGGEELSVSVNPQTAERIRRYLDGAGHAQDLDGPLFRPVRNTGRPRSGTLPPVRALHPDGIDRILHRYAKEVGLESGFSAHSMRTTFITTALDNGASLEDVQRDVGHADPSTTKLYDRRGHNAERSASFFANY